MQATLNPAPSPVALPPAADARMGRMPRLPVLDGWRACSILAVLACHMLPLGPAHWRLNVAAGCMGMSIFFTLSGFLITSTLYFHPSVRDFIIRRLFRILPVVFLFVLIVLPFAHASAATWRATLLFYANLPPYHLLPLTDHLWSLCLEVQFYAAIAVLFLLFRQRSLALLPFLCVAVTLNRMRLHEMPDIATLSRIDDILSGAALAYLFHSRFSVALRRALVHLPPAIPLVLLCLACHPAFPLLNQFRPYFAAAMVGATLFHDGTVWKRVLESKPLAYIASISYALYIWHPLTTHGWFDPASKTAKYLRRPLGIAISVLIAHLSTNHFERFFIQIGKRLTGPRRVHAPNHARPEASPNGVPSADAV